MDLKREIEKETVYMLNKLICLWCVMKDGIEDDVFCFWFGRFNDDRRKGRR